jgi:hypothetical protein
MENVTARVAKFYCYHGSYVPDVFIACAQGPFTGYFVDVANQTIIVEDGPDLVPAVNVLVAVDVVALILG